MSQNIFAIFLVGKKMNIDMFKQILKKINKNAYNENKIQFDDKILKAYSYSFTDYFGEDKFRITVFWKYKSNHFYLSIPALKEVHIYGREILLKYYKIINSSIYLYDSGSIDEELKIFGNYITEKIRIWTANLFTPEEVKKYGKEKLLSSPCEQIEEWEGGAIFMMIHKNSFSSTYEERKRLREHLGEHVK